MMKYLFLSPLLFHNNLLIILMNRNVNISNVNTRQSLGIKIKKIMRLLYNYVYSCYLWKLIHVQERIEFIMECIEHNSTLVCNIPGPHIMSENQSAISLSGINPYSPSVRAAIALWLEY